MTKNRIFHLLHLSLAARKARFVLPYFALPLKNADNIRLRGWLRIIHVGNWMISVVLSRLMLYG